MSSDYTGPQWPGTYQPFGYERLSESVQRAVGSYIEQHHLTPEFEARLNPVYLPMASWLSDQTDLRMSDPDSSGPIIIGINGGQGSGKSTLAGLLDVLLTHQHDKRVVHLSIDDFYLGHEVRTQLALDIHPLMQTRGVPGTHDIPLALDLFSRLRRGETGVVSRPDFDKSIDDVVPIAEWASLNLPVDIVLFEGWCVGARSQREEDLVEPVNRLESKEDLDLTWRRYVNDQLAGMYQKWFEYIDILMMLKVPSMEQVYEWRGLQESKLKANSTGQAVMDQEALLRFIMHYERLTRHQLEEMPARADVLMPLDVNHQIADIFLR